MATEHKWISIDGDWGNTASWDSGQVPGGGGVFTDTVMFDGTSVVSVSSGLDQTAGNGILKLITTPEYTGDIGSSGVKLQIEFKISDSRVIHRGTGTLYLSSEAGNFAEVIIDSTNLVNAASLTASFNNVLVKGGKVTIEAGATLVGDLILLGTTARVNVVAGGGAGPQHVRILAGACTNARTTPGTVGIPDDIVVAGGTLTQTGVIQTETRVTITGGRMVYTPGVSIGTEKPDIYILGGTLDLSANLQDIDVANVITGPGATVFGNINKSGFGATGVDIDLREDYP